MRCDSARKRAVRLMAVDSARRACADKGKAAINATPATVRSACRRLAARLDMNVKSMFCMLGILIVPPAHGH